MKPTIILFGIFLLITCSTYSFAITPTYTITIELKNKNIELDESLNYSIYIRGGGYCSKAYYAVSTEGVLTSDYYVISGSVNRSTPKPLIIEGQPTQYCYQNGKVLSENLSGIAIPNEAGQVRTDVLDLFNKDGYIEMENIGTMRPRKDSNPGYYKMNVVLSCLNNGQWYNFQDSQEFRVLSKGEVEQFVTAKKAFYASVFALIISLFSLFLSEKRKEKIINWLKNKF